MPTPQQVYERYRIKAEKNATNDNQSTDKGRFTELYNELAPRFCKWYLNNRNRDDIKDINVLLVDDKKIYPDNNHLDHTDFKLPKDFMSWSFTRGVASKGECKTEPIRLFEIKDEDRGDIMTNQFFSPSFEYREAPYNYSSNKIKVYREKGMDINNIYLSYYRYPNKIKLQDPNNPEGDFQQTEIEFNEEVLNRIISAMVGDFKINNNDPSFKSEQFRQKENLK